MSGVESVLGDHAALQEEMRRPGSREGRVGVLVELVGDLLAAVPELTPDSVYFLAPLLTTRGASRAESLEAYVRHEGRAYYLYDHSEHGAALDGEARGLIGSRGEEARWSRTVPVARVREVLAGPSERADPVLVGSVIDRADALGLARGPDLPVVLDVLLTGYGVTGAEAGEASALVELLEGGAPLAWVARRAEAGSLRLDAP